MFSTYLSLHFDFVLGKWNVNIWGQNETCWHSVEVLSEDNILFHIVIITVMIASFNAASFPVPVLLQCPPTNFFYLLSSPCFHCSFKDYYWLKQFLLLELKMVYLYFYIMKTMKLHLSSHGLSAPFFHFLQVCCPVPFCSDLVR